MVGVDSLRGGLDTAAVRDQIAGTRAVAYTNADGSSSTLSGTPGQTVAPESTSFDVADCDTNPEEAQITDAAEGVSSAENILDEKLNIGDTLNELQGIDCASGGDMNIRTDGEFVPPGARLWDSGAIKTSAWVDAATPPVSAAFVAGIRWTSTSDCPNTFFGSSPGGVATAQISDENACLGGGDTGNAAVTNIEILTPTSRRVTYTLDNPSFPVDGREHSHIISSSACTLDVDASCPSIPPRDEFWPDDTNGEAFMHTFKDGAFISSVYDSRVPTEHVAPLAEIDFCNDTDARVGRIEATQNGGFMISELDMVGGTTIGQYQIFSTEGVLTGYANEATAELLRPNAS